MLKVLNEPGGNSAWQVGMLRVRYNLRHRPLPIHDAQDAAKILHAMWDPELINVQEQISALYLNSRDEAIGYRLISTGKLNAAQLDTPLLLSIGLLLRAKSIILAHNHPTGDPTPSRTDIRMTCQLSKTIQLVGMELYDHLILVQDGYHSMADGRNFLPTRLYTPKS